VPNGDEIALRAADGTHTLDLRTGKLTSGGLAPFDRGTLTVVDPRQTTMYVTQRGLLGFRVIDMRTGATSAVVHFKGFTWNPRFGPNPPSHGLVLRPDRPELWVLDAPNHALHVFDVSEAPRRVADVRLETTLTAPGSLTQSADGRYLYVGGAGDVIDSQTQKSIANLPPLMHASAVLEVDSVDGRPVFPGFPR
jgi:DNA-binding beta-propeller fold protein YncE